MFYRDYFTRAEDFKGFDQNLYSVKISSYNRDKMAANLFKIAYLIM